MTKQISISEFKNLKKPRNKFGAKPKVYNGVKYASTKEAKRAMELDILLKAGEIKSYKRQVKFSIDLWDKHICNYIADFEIHYAGKRVIEDVKGYKKGVAYEMFKLKKKLVEALYGIEIIER